MPISPYYRPMSEAEKVARQIAPFAFPPEFVGPPERYPRVKKKVMDLSDFSQGPVNPYDSQMSEAEKVARQIAPFAFPNQFVGPPERYRRVKKKVIDSFDEKPKPQPQSEPPITELDLGVIRATEYDPRLLANRRVPDRIMPELSSTTEIPMKPESVMSEPVKAAQPEKPKPLQQVHKLDDSSRRYTPANTSDDLWLKYLGQLSKSVANIPVGGRKMDETLSGLTDNLYSELQRKERELYEMEQQKPIFDLNTSKARLAALELGAAPQRLMQEAVRRDQEIRGAETDLELSGAKARNALRQEQAMLSLAEQNSEATKILKNVLKQYGIDASNMTGDEILALYPALQPVFDEAKARAAFERALALKLAKQKEEPTLQEKVDEKLLTTQPTESATRSVYRLANIQSARKIIEDSFRKGWKPSKAFSVYLTQYKEIPTDLASLSALVSKGLLTEQDKNMAYAVGTILQATGRIESGAAITEKEWADFNKIFGLTEADTPQTIKEKMNNLQSLEDAIRTDAFHSLRKAELIEKYGLAPQKSKRQESKGSKRVIIDPEDL